MCSMKPASLGQGHLCILVCFASFLEIYIYAHAIKKFPVLLTSFSKRFESWSSVLFYEQWSMEYNVENVVIDICYQCLKSNTESVFSHKYHYHTQISGALIKPIQLKL